MSWKVVAVVGACAGGVAWAVQRRWRRPADDSGWSAATDTVVPAPLSPTGPSPASV